MLIEQPLNTWNEKLIEKLPKDSMNMISEVIVGKCLQ